MTSTEDQARARFDAWLEGYGRVSHGIKLFMFDAWQAAERATAERAAKVMKAAESIFPAWQEYLDNTNCGEMCDATYETRGCHGVCALDAGKKHAREAMAALNELQGASSNKQ